MSGPVPEGLVEHAAIDKAFRALLSGLDGTGEVVTLFRDFADLVRQHIASEDLDIARFADVDAEEAKALLVEHLDIRETLDALAAQLQAGKLSSKDVHTFKVRFSLHEAREELGLYRNKPAP